MAPFALRPWYVDRVPPNADIAYRMPKPARYGTSPSHYLKTSLFGLGADAANRFSRAPVTGSVPVAVSLTTHSIRIGRVYRTIESIARGTVKPQRLLLWLGQQEEELALPRTLQRLQRRGLEVRYAPDVGPHTKYYPYACSEAAHRLPLVTADDDMWYPPFWLERLWQAHQRDPARVHCYRARRVQLDGTRLLPYETWPFMDDDRPGPRVFATGVGGVIYPPALLDRLRVQGTAFAQCCPEADDLWLHVCALRHGFEVQQLSPDVMEFETMPATQSIGLQNRNVAMSRNDIQAAATYTPADLELMRRSG